MDPWRRGVVLALALTAASTVRAQSEMVVDLEPGSPWGVSSNPEGFVVLGNAAFFAAGDDRVGNEPWRTDGTPDGTWPLVDIVPGRDDSSPDSFAAAGGLLYFRASEACAGREAWVSDGTPQGTRVLADVWPGPAPSSATGFAAWRGFVVFSANDGVHGPEPWITDGTESGTRLLADVVPGPDGSRPWAFTATRHGVVFGVRREDGSNDLWTIDAGFVATRLLEVDDSPGLSSLVPYGDRALISFTDGSQSERVWITDGTPAGTVRLDSDSAGLYDPRFVGEVNGRYLFYAESDIGAEPWVTDGTPAGTELLVAGGATYYWYQSLGSSGAGLWLLGYDFFEGAALWTSDGTAAGTRRVMTLARAPAWARVVGEACYLWTEGEGLSIVDAGGKRPLASASDTSSWQTWPLGPVDLGGRLVFAQDGGGGVGVEPWISDGTTEGTRVLRDVRAGSFTWGSFPDHLVELNGRLLFAAQIQSVGTTLFTTDDSVARVHLLRDAEPKAPEGLTRVGDRVYFVASDAAGREPWCTDGTWEGTRRIKDISPTSSLTGQEDLVAFAGRVYFPALGGDASGVELWSTDGTEAGTRRVHDVNPGPGSSNPSRLTVAGNLLYFDATDGATGVELWVTDGTSAGTRRVTDFMPGSADTWPTGHAELGDRLVFFAPTPTLGREPWITDGTPGGTLLLGDIHPGIDDGWPEAFVVAGGLYYFTSWFGPEETVWRTDGTPAGTIELGSRATGLGGYQRYFTALGDTCYFRSKDWNENWTLWRSDGTRAGTRVVATEGTPQSELVPIDGRLVFTALAPGGKEPWLTDGTAEGTHRLLDVWPGDGWSDAAGYTACGTRVYFSADDGVHGRELHSFPRAMLSDFDLDGVLDEVDNCRWAADADQDDRDADGHGDACDACSLDGNPSQSDADCDGVGDACEFSWGDVAPAGAPDGRVDVADVVRLLRITVGVDVPSSDERLRGDVAPATSLAPGVLRPTSGLPRTIDVADVVLALRASVGLVRFEAPR